MKLKHLTALLTGMILTMFLCMTVSAQIQSVELGEKMEDFTVETANAGTFTLSEELEKHDMVLINLWGIFCGPCRSEMPFMQEAYSEYSDRVSLVALSIDPNDTPDKIVKYADELGLTFPMGSDSETGIYEASDGSGVPTSIVVDRFGNVAMITSGAEVETSRFTEMFDFFLSDDYTETVKLNHFPGAKPVEGVSEEELNENANAEGSDLQFHNSDAPLAWPAIPEEHDGRKALTFSNSGKMGTTGYLVTNFSASDGDALAFDFCSELDNSGLYPTLLFAGEGVTLEKLDVTIDGERLISIVDSYDWTTRAIPLSEGEHEVIFSYSTSEAELPDNKVWLSNIHIATGDEAQELFESLPLDGTADFFEIYPTESLKQITLTGENAEETAWVTDEDSVMVHVALSEDENPANTVFFTIGKDYESVGGSIFKCATPSGDGYDLSIPLPEGEFAFLYVIPGINQDELYQADSLILVHGDDGIESMAEFYQNFFGEAVEVNYATTGDTDSETEAQEDSASDQDGAKATAYTVTVVDQNGDPVQGVYVNFCTDDSCTPCITDESGVATYDGAPTRYHLQILMVPEGYSFDASFEDYTEETYSSKTIEITKD